MAELNKAFDPAPSGSFYARLGGKLGVPRIRSDRDLASLVEKRMLAGRKGPTAFRRGLSFADPTLGAPLPPVEHGQVVPPAPSGAGPAEKMDAAPIDTSSE